MRFTYIPTTTTAFNALRAEAKRLSRLSGDPGPKHTDLLETVAKAAGYSNWHHATWCHANRDCFVGPVQERVIPRDHLQAFLERGEDYPGYIAFSVTEGRAGQQQLADAIRQGIKVPQDLKYILFKQDDESGEEALCEDYSGSGE